MTLQKVQHNGIVSFYLSDADNLVFHRLPPKAASVAERDAQRDGAPTQDYQAGKYFYSITLTHATDECGGRGEPSRTIPVKIVSSDPEQPLNFLMSSIDRSVVSNVDSVVQYDHVVKAGRNGRIYVTLRNQQMMQLDSWPTDLSKEFLVQFFIEETSGKWVANDANCIVNRTHGLYPGELMAWYNCKETAKPQAFSIKYQSTVLLPSRRLFKVINDDTLLVSFDEDITKALASGPIVVDSKENAGLLLNL